MNYHLRCWLVTITNNLSILYVVKNYNSQPLFLGAATTFIMAITFTAAFPFPAATALSAAATFIMASTFIVAANFITTFSPIRNRLKLVKPRNNYADIQKSRFIKVRD